MVVYLLHVGRLGRILVYALQIHHMLVGAVVYIQWNYIMSYSWVNLIFDFMDGRVHRLSSYLEWPNMSLRLSTSETVYIYCALNVERFFIPCIVVLMVYTDLYPTELKADVL